jgi:hypothetical protein
VGTWIGTYRCGQGQTGLRLVVTGDDPDSLAAAFRFFPVADNPGVPSGSFAMTGSRSGRDVRLRQSAWIDQPPGYVMVDLVGELTDDGERFAGTVQGAGCTTFALRRA